MWGNSVNQLCLGFSRPVGDRALILREREKQQNSERQQWCARSVSVFWFSLCDWFSSNWNHVVWTIRFRHLKLIFVNFVLILCLVVCRWEEAIEGDSAGQVERRSEQYYRRRWPQDQREQAPLQKEQVLFFLLV
jgi:hypothetical protein